MTRMFKKSDGTLIPCREYAPFRGTFRYASPNMLSYKDSQPSDDMMSLLYSIVCLFVCLV